MQLIEKYIYTSKSGYLLNLVTLNIRDKEIAG